MQGRDEISFPQVKVPSSSELRHERQTGRGGEVGPNCGVAATSLSLCHNRQTGKPFPLAEFFHNLRGGIRFHQGLDGFFEAFPQEGGPAFEIQDQPFPFLAHLEKGEQQNPDADDDKDGKDDPKRDPQELLRKYSFFAPIFPPLPFCQFACRILRFLIK
jgi:hypothetical protein